MGKPPALTVPWLAHITPGDTDFKHPEQLFQCKDVVDSVGRRGLYECVEIHVIDFYMRKIVCPHLISLVVSFLNLDTFYGQIHNLLMLARASMLPITVSKGRQPGGVICQTGVIYVVFFLKKFP